MVYGIGTDIVKIERIKKLTDIYGDRFIQRILSDSELTILKWGRRYNFIAGRFAAKEALYKAMGSTCNIRFRELEILNDENNKPYLYNVDRIKMELEIDNETSFKAHVSISHEIDYAIASVILETE